MSSAPRSSSSDAKASCACATPSPQQLEHRGMAWIAGAFLFCPCHLPLTLWAIAALLSGTAAGALWARHPIVAILVVVTIVLAHVAGWRGGTRR